MISLYNVRLRLFKPDIRNTKDDVLDNSSEAHKVKAEYLKDLFYPKITNRNLDYHISYEFHSCFYEESRF